jgi:chromosome segregation ATPase
LKSKLKEKYNFYQTILEEEKKNHLTKILQKHFSMIEYKVHSKEILRVDQIENEFKLLENKTEIYNEFKLKDEIINSFKYKVFGFCLEFFQNQFENEITIINSKLNELTEKYNIELSELKTSNEKEIAKKTTHIENQKVEIYNLRNQYSLLKEDFALLQNDRDQQIKQLNDKLVNQKDDSDSTIKELSEKLSYIEEKKRESERRVITIQGEYEKQKALLDQRIEFYSKQLEDYNKREKESVIELRSQIKEQQNAIKDNNSKYDNVIKSLNNQIEELQEKMVDYETIISGKESLLEIEKSKLEEHSIKHNMEVEDLKEKLSSIKNKLESERIKNGDEIRLKETEYSCKYNISLNKIEELELKMKNSEENSKSIIIQIERENAILRQNNEFLELQLKELNNLMEEQKKSHESILTRLEMKSSAEEGHEEYTKKIEELKEFFSLEKKQLEENFEKTRQLYLNQVMVL